MPAGHYGLSWVAIWVDGRSLSASSAEQCMNSLTGVTTAQLNPPSGLPVQAGTIASAEGCQV